MSEHGQKTCQCGTTFVFRKHERSGIPAPICVEPDPKGNIAILADGRYRVITKGESHDGPRFVNHFTNCSKAKSFKKRVAPR